MMKAPFNATTARFDYRVEEMMKSEVPGPGQYNAKNVNQTSSSMFLTEERPHKGETSAIFKDKTGRESHNHYIEKEKTKFAVGPQEYFKAG